MAKNDDFSDFFGDDDDTPVIDTRADGRLYRVPLNRLSPNLVNPRTDFGTEDDLIDFGKSIARRQNQPCPVVSRGAYLKLWPDHADRIGDVDYVLVSGERRYRGATAVGHPALDCVVNDDFARDRKTFMEAVVSENVDRQNFDPIEEAFAVQALVREFGSNRAVAQHFERVDGWVTQRILLTHLDREVQDLVRQKTIPLEAARTLGKLARDNAWTAAEQIAWWEEEQQRRGAAAAARAAARKAAKQPQQHGTQTASPSFTAVKHEGAAPTTRTTPAPGPTATSNRSDGAEQAPSTKAVASPSSAAPPAAARTEPTQPQEKDFPEPRQSESDPAAEADKQEPKPRVLDYTDAGFIDMHLDVKMTSEHWARLARLMASRSWDKAGTEEAFGLLQEMLDCAAERDRDQLVRLLQQALAQYQVAAQV